MITIFLQTVWFLAWYSLLELVKSVGLGCVWSCHHHSCNWCHTQRRISSKGIINFEIAYVCLYIILKNSTNLVYGSMAITDNTDNSGMAQFVVLSEAVLESWCIHYNVYWNFENIYPVCSHICHLYHCIWLWISLSFD